jgi:Bcr/CflA subfamily drug resistance transporter
MNASTKTSIPPIWLLVLIVGLPILSETVYTPSLPDIAKSLKVDESIAEYTLTIYLFAFAIGTCFFGRVSDKYGRKPCLLLGFCIYLFGCLGCFFSHSITYLLISRFIQGFGGSSGSVLGQAISRDSFQGKTLGKVFASVGSALSIFPAIGPVLGGIIDQKFGWSYVFILLTLVGSVVFIAIIKFLPETHDIKFQQSSSILKTAYQMMKDPSVLYFGVLVAGCNGIAFSYFAEGSFYLIDLLGLTPSSYGMTFFVIALSCFIGGKVSKYLHNNLSSKEILKMGLYVVLSGSSLFIVSIFTLNKASFPKNYFILLTLLSMMTIFLGTNMVVPNILSIALENYRSIIGTASSLFGFYYYTLISFVTFFMGIIHNDTLFPMPIYFFFISILMLIIFKKGINKRI